MMREERFTLEGFQKNMLMRFILITAAGLAVGSVLFYIITQRRLNEVLYTFHMPRSIEDFLLSYAVTANLCGLLVVIAALVLTMKSIFWKVSGPLFRVSQDVQKLTGGDLTVNIRLRKYDEFKDMAEDFDLMGKAMRDKFRKIKEQCAELSATASDMGIHYDNRELLTGKSALLKKNIEGLREGLDKFKI